MNKKEAVYKELCELGKLGINVTPKAFRILEEADLKNEYQCMSISSIADLIINLS